MMFFVFYGRELSPHCWGHKRWWSFTISGSKASVFRLSTGEAQDIWKIDKRAIINNNNVMKSPYNMVFLLKQQWFTI